VLLASAFLVVLGVPVLALLSAGTAEAIASEDHVSAEVLCSQLVEEALAMPFGALERRASFEEVRVVTVGPRDGAAIVVHDPALRPARGYRLTLSVRAVEPGLLAIEASAAWDMKGASRRYALLRLKARENLSAGGRPPAP
jgi:hypothetical protein